MEQNQIKYNALTQEKHKHYELAYKAYYNNSFNPEKMAERICKEFDDDIKKLKEIGASENQIIKTEKLFIIWLARLSRCASTMITGSGNFDFYRNNKKRMQEHNACKSYSEYIKHITSKLEIEKFYNENPTKRPIKSSDEDAKERLKNKIELLEQLQQKMKYENKQAKKNGLSHIHESFKLTNNLAKIKDAKLNLAKIENIEKIGDIEQQITKDILFKIDSLNKRVYFKFEGKPDEEIRSLLKSNGFKWTPSKGHWGRLLTANAKYSAKNIILKLEQNN